MRILFIVFLLVGCSALPNNPDPKTIAAGASGRVDYCVSLLGTNLFCIKAMRELEVK